MTKTDRNTGGDVNYYLVEVPHPKRLTPYTMEVEDIIEALDMNFAEGVVFKALIRRCQARKTGVMKQGYDGPQYDGEKMAYYSARIVAQDKAREVEITAAVKEMLATPSLSGTLSFTGGDPHVGDIHAHGQLRVGDLQIDTVEFFKP